MTFIVQDSPNHCLVNSVSFITVFGMSMRCIVRVSHIFGLCREFFLDVHQLKICSSAQETGRMIIQTLVVSAAECLSNVAQSL